MSLIKCPECGGQLSSRAPTCPHCGYPQRPPDTFPWRLALLVIMVVALTWALPAEQRLFALMILSVLGLFSFFAKG